MKKKQNLGVLKEKSDQKLDELTDCECYMVDKKLAEYIRAKHEYISSIKN